MLFTVSEFKVGSLTYVNSFIFALIINSVSFSEYVLFCI